MLALRGGFVGVGRFLDVYSQLGLLSIAAVSFKETGRALIRIRQPYFDMSTLRVGP
jgi:hypothetical protein